MMVTKIESLDEKAQTKVLELKGMGWSNPQIADYLNENYLTESMAKEGSFNSGDVYRFINRNQERAIEIMKKSGKFEKKMAERYMDTIDQLIELNNEMWDEFYKLKTDPEYKEKTVSCAHCGKPTKIQLQDHASLLKAADHILKQVQHVDQILGKLTKKSLQISYNITDINNKISTALPAVLDRMEREGRLDAINRILKKKKKKMLEQLENDR